jgi:hypothetical protein
MSPPILGPNKQSKTQLSQLEDVIGVILLPSGDIYKRFLYLYNKDVMFLSNNINGYKTDFNP